MTHYKYLIVGGGMAADSAVRGIREIDANGTIGLISMESDPPYDRPPLSKGLWKGKPLAKIWRHTQALGLDLILNRRVDRLDPQNKQLSVQDGTVYTFDRLLLATGGRPRRMPFADDNVLYFRTLQDYQKLRALTDHKERFAVIGGGYIGSELAAALAMNGKQVVFVVHGTTIGQHIYPADLGRFLNSYYEERGVELVTNSSVVAVEKEGARVRVKTRNAQDRTVREFLVDAAVAGVGIEPNVELARAAELETDAGIAVDSYLRTNHPDLYAAGDVASFYQPALGRRLRVEHEDNANSMGRAAGRNMAGEAEPYYHLPYFYSDLFDLGYEAVGDLDTEYEQIANWEEPYRRGTVYYLRGGRIKGILLWNVWDQVEAARRLIAGRASFQALDLLASTS